MPASLCSCFQGLKGFEAGFGQVRAHDDTLTTALLRSMGGYFLKFNADENEYDELLEKLVRGGVRLAVATLNYDLLLDQALARLSQKFGKADLKASVLKVHGAPTFWPTSRVRISGCTFSGASECNVDAPVEEVSVDRALVRAREDDSVAPAMALYSESKEMLFCKSFLDEIRARFRSLVTEADEVLIVGVAYAPHDRHVWEPLEISPATIHIVNPDAASFVGFERERALTGRSTLRHAKSLTDFIAA
jgi:hypothetical protein